MPDSANDASSQVDEIDAYFADAKRRYPYRDRSAALAYSYLLRGGVFQLHRFYLQMYRSALVRAGVFVFFACIGLGVAMLGAVGPGAFLLMIAFVFAFATMIVDFFRLPEMVEDCNSVLRRKRIELGLE